MNICAITSSIKMRNQNGTFLRWSAYVSRFFYIIQHLNYDWPVWPSWIFTTATSGEKDGTLAPCARSKNEKKSLCTCTCKFRIEKKKKNSKNNTSFFMVFFFFISDDKTSHRLWRLWVKTTKTHNMVKVYFVNKSLVICSIIFHFHEIFHSWKNVRV